MAHPRDKNNRFAADFKKALENRLKRIGLDTPKNTYQAISLFHGVDIESTQPIKIARKDGTNTELSTNELKILRTWMDGVSEAKQPAAAGFSHDAWSAAIRYLAYRLGLPHLSRYPEILTEAHQLIQGKNNACGPANIRLTHNKPCLPVGMHLEQSRWVDTTHADKLRTAANTLIHKDNRVCARDEPYNENFQVVQHLGGAKIISRDGSTQAHLEPIGEQMRHSTLLEVSSTDPVITIHGLGPFKILRENSQWNTIADKRLLAIASAPTSTHTPFEKKTAKLIHMRILGHQLLFLQSMVWSNCEFNPASPGCNGRMHGIAQVPPDTNWSKSISRREYFLSRFPYEMQTWIRYYLQGYSRTQAVSREQQLGKKNIPHPSSHAIFLKNARSLAGVDSKHGPNAEVLIAKTWGIDFKKMDPTLITQDRTYTISPEMIYSLDQLSKGKRRADIGGMPGGFSSTSTYDVGIVAVKRALAKEPDFPRNMSLGRLMIRIWLLNRSMDAN